MAIVRAVKSGNWSDPTVWSTGALPTSADDVFCNTFTITISQSVNVKSIQNSATTGVTAGGVINISGISGTPITITCSGAGIVYSNYSLNISLGSNVIVNIISNLTPTATGRCGNIYGPTGTLNITGNVGNFGASVGTSLLQNSSITALNITGNLYASNGGNGSVFDFQNISTTLTVVGNIYSSGNVPIANPTSASIVNHTGACYAQNGVPVHSYNGPTVTLTGPFYVSTNGTHAVFCPNWKWQNTSPPATMYEIRTANLATIRPLYTADSVGGNPAITNVRSGTVFGPAGELTGTCAVPGAASVAVGVPVDNTVGTAAITAASIRSAMGLASANLDTQLSPLPNLDATVSSRLATSGYTVPLTASDTRSALGLASANLDTQLTTLPNLDTTVSSRSTFNPATDTVANVTLVDTTTNLTNPPDVPTTAEIATAVANELEPALTNLDNDILSRLASVDYTVPPTAQQNAEAVEVQLALPLGNMDVAVSTRSTFNPATDTVANVTLVDTTTNLTNPPVVPTTSEIATAVADTLDPTLTQIDNDVLSRLATVNYTTPPTAEQNAEAVRVELSPELDRVANCATVATTGQQIQDALTPP